MTLKEFNFIKDAFSQIIDDIAGNPEWKEAASAIASDLGALERELEKKVIEIPSNLDEAAIDFADNARKSLFTKDYAVSSIADYDHGCIDGFKAGAEWMAGQGFSFQDEVILCGSTPFLKDADFDILEAPESFKPSDKVIVQIRKK